MTKTPEEKTSLAEALVELLEDAGVTVTFDRFRDVTKGCGPHCVAWAESRSREYCSNHRAAIERGEYKEKKVGNCFWVLVFDGYGCGLDLISPRMFEIYDAQRVFRYNSFSYTSEQDIDDFIAKHKLLEKYGHHFKIIR